MFVSRFCELKVDGKPPIYTPNFLGHEAKLELGATSSHERCWMVARVVLDVQK